MKKTSLFMILFALFFAVFASAETIELSLEPKYLEGSLSFGGKTYSVDAQLPSKVIFENDEVPLTHLIQDKYSGQWLRENKVFNQGLQQYFVSSSKKYNFEVDASDQVLKFTSWEKVVGIDSNALLSPETMEIGAWNEQGYSYQVTVKNNVVKIIGPIIYNIALSNNQGTWSFQGSNRYVVYNPTAKKLTVSTGTTQEIAVYQSGSNYLGNLNMGGQTFGVDFNPGTNSLKMTYPDSTISENTITNNQGTWNYQGTSYHMQIDLVNSKIIFSTGTTMEITLSTQNVYTGTLNMAGWSYNLIYYPGAQKIIATKIYQSDFSAQPDVRDISLSQSSSLLTGAWLSDDQLVSYRVEININENKFRLYDPPEFDVPKEITLNPYFFTATFSKGGETFDLSLNTKAQKLILDGSNTYELALIKESSSKYTGTWNYQGQSYDIETNLDNLRIYFRSGTTSTPITTPTPVPPSPQPAPPAPTPVPTSQPTAQTGCSGCFVEGKCLPYGTRFNGDYCDLSGNMTSQKSSSAQCNNNYECSSNLCVNDQCLSRSLIQRVIEWLTRLFS